MSTELDPQLTTLIQLLYASALDEQLLSGMADKLAQAFDATSASIKVYHAGQPQADPPVSG